MWMHNTFFSFSFLLAANLVFVFATTLQFHVSHCAKSLICNDMLFDRVEKLPPHFPFPVWLLRQQITNRRGNDLMNSCLSLQVLLSQWLAVFIVVIGNGCDARSTRVSAQYTVGDGSERTFGTRGIVEDASVIEDGGIFTKAPRPTRVSII